MFCQELELLKVFLQLYANLVSNKLKAGAPLILKLPQYIAILVRGKSNTVGHDALKLKIVDEEKQNGVESVFQEITPNHFSSLDILLYLLYPAQSMWL